jgi:hypothetical protein
MILKFFLSSSIVNLNGQNHAASKEVDKKYPLGSAPKGFWRPVE